MSDSYTIENSTLLIEVAGKGAEMKRLFSKEWNRELLWSGDQRVWPRFAPILFPIVGRLKDDEYVLKGKTYKMTQHGFARDMLFTNAECGVSEVEYLLVATQETFTWYPFCFELRVRYELGPNRVVITYSVKNDDRQDIYFSIGAHPGFVTENISDYEIHFQCDEGVYYRSFQDGLLDWSTAHSLSGQKMKVNPDLFREGALIFKNMKSEYVDLVDTLRDETIRVKASTDYWGIWGKGETPFICLEPWHGVADAPEHDKNFEGKEGVMTLAAGKTFDFSYSIELLGSEVQGKEA